MNVLQWYFYLMAVLSYCGIEINLLIVKISNLGYSSVFIMVKVFCQGHSWLSPPHTTVSWWRNITLYVWLL